MHNDFKKTHMATEKQLEKLQAQLDALKLNGKRKRKPGGGAPKKDDTKVQCFAYIERSKVDLFGGKKEVQEFMKDAVNIEYEKLKNA